MKRQLFIIFSAAVIFFLLGTMFSTNYLATGGKSLSAWDAINDLTAKVNDLNTTVIQQQAQITELQTQLDILKATKLGKPDYDSGWQNIAKGQILTLVHNLGTTDVFVYVVGNGIRNGITQVDYGYTVIPPDRYGLAWARLTTSTINVYRALQDESWEQVRVMIWIAG